MPKESRRRAVAHERSVKLTKRESNTIQHAEIGGSSINPITESQAEDKTELAASNVTLNKKEKLSSKREAFLQKLEAGRSPYSKSHNRRVKRKAKEQLGGGLNDIQQAISAMVKDTIETAHTIEDAQADSSEGVKSKSGPKQVKIGEGKGAPLSKAQRKRALELEKLRHPLILTNTEFSANPFQTIRTHAQNTLLKHEIPS